jgi:ABC-type multidrug transport system permease subunit
MRITGVIKKCLKEQYRSFWLLILTVSTAPFFVLVYNLITKSYIPVYDVLILNNDKGAQIKTSVINLGDSLISSMMFNQDQACKTGRIENKMDAMVKLKNKKADLLMILPENFSSSLKTADSGNSLIPFDLEFLGNITDINYIITAIIAYNSVSDFVTRETGIQSPFNFKETGIGTSGTLTDFELAVPGLIIFSIIMLMLSASVAMIAEVENKTMHRLNMSGVSTLELMGGITVVQILVGFLSVVLTLAIASWLGFRFQGSVVLVFLVLLLTIISIIAFSLFIAALSKTVTQVLIIGNFPLFLFMFFTGAMFPINTTPWFTIKGYSISIISLMSPAHSVSALNKILIMQDGFRNILPELICLVLLIILYYAFGIWAYRRRHMVN